MPDGHPPLFTSVRQPPANAQAEQGLLGAILANNKALDRCGDLRGEHFADPLHGWLFEEFAKRIRAGRVVDAVSLNTEIQHAAQWEANGADSGYLARLMGAMVAIINTTEYAFAIRDAWRRREAIDIGEELVNGSFGTDTHSDSEAVITRTMERLLSLSEAGAERQATDHGSALDAAVAQAEAAHKRVPGKGRLDTGIAAVDALWRGLWPGELYFLMARSRTGKTPFMMQIARGVAAQITREGQPGCVHVFSLEMDAAGIARLGLTAEGPWDADQLKSGEIGDDRAWNRLSEIRSNLAALPILVDDTPEINMADLAMRARVVARQKRTRLICIDFRQLIRRPKDLARMPMSEWLPTLSYQLKALARTLSVPVVCLEQINKSVDSRESTRPMLGDLPFGGDPAADAVFALWRPELAMGDAPPRPTQAVTAEKQQERDNAWWKAREEVRGMAEFIACKRRGGGTGFKRLKFDGPSQIFRPIEGPVADMLDHVPANEDEYGAHP